MVSPTPKGRARGAEELLKGGFGSGDVSNSETPPSVMRNVMNVMNHCTLQAFRGTQFLSFAELGSTGTFFSKGHK